MAEVRAEDGLKRDAPRQRLPRVGLGNGRIVRLTPEKEALKDRGDIRDVVDAGFSEVVALDRGIVALGSGGTKDRGIFVGSAPLLQHELIPFGCVDARGV